MSRQVEIQKGFCVMLKGICPERGEFSPAAVQTAPRPCDGFERCTAYAHYPPVKDKSHRVLMWGSYYWDQASANALHFTFL